MIIVFVLLTFLWGIGSLLLVAAKTHTLRTVFFKKPSIIIGDFFILPTLAAIIANNYLKNGVENISAKLILLILAISLALTLISRTRFALTSVWWIPHLLFYWSMAFVVLLFLSSFTISSSLWWLVLTGIIVHQLLGILFPKRFPRINK